MSWRVSLQQVARLMSVALWLVGCGSRVSAPSPEPSLPAATTVLVPTVAPVAEPGEFSIYLPAPRVAADQLTALEAIELEQEPIVAGNDIIVYDWLMHEIELTAAAYERVGQLEVPVDGTPFVVCLGREPVYVGAFWPLYSSLTFDGVVITVPLTDGHTVQIALGYPSPSFFAGEDPRSDPSIWQSLERAGKLK
jgi:hypothetical protein